MNTYEPLSIERIIQGAVKIRLAEIVDEEVAACHQRIKDRMAKEADALALSVFSQYDVTTNAQCIMITVKKVAD